MDIMGEIMNFSRKVNKLSKAVDYVVEEVIPAIFKENTDKVYQILWKEINDGAMKLL